MSVYDPYRKPKEDVGLKPEQVDPQSIAMGEVFPADDGVFYSLNRTQDAIGIVCRTQVDGKDVQFRLHVDKALTIVSATKLVF